MFLGVAILPLYVRFLGAEAYGLVGLYATLAVICSLFDAGISASLGRELARANAGDAPGRQIAELVRTAEVLYVAIGLVLGALIAAAAPLIVTKWLNLKTLSADDAIRAVRLMGIYFVFQWSMGIYAAGLSGLQKQVELNIVNSIGSTFRAVGAVVVLWKISPTAVAFYCWQVVATALYTVAIREVLWRDRGINRNDAAFKWTVASQVRGFAGGITLLSMLSVMVSQLDKVVLTRLVSLESFGYYSFATSVAGAVTFFGQSILTATYPAMIEAFSRRDEARLTYLFHRAAQLVSLTIFAPAAVLCAFAPIVLRLWARDPATVANASTLVSACLAGAALNGVAVIPYSLSLAAGRVRPAMMAAASGALIYAAVLAFLAPRFGVLSGAVGSAFVNLAGLLVYARWAVKPLLPGHARRWLVTDLLVPLSTAGAVASLARAAVSPSASQHGQAAGLFLASFVTLVCTALATPAARHEVASRMQALRSRSTRLF